MNPLKYILIVALLILALPQNTVCQSYDEWLDIGLRQLQEDQMDSAKISFKNLYKSDKKDHKILAVRGLIKTAIFKSDLSEIDSLIDIGDSLCLNEKYNKSIFLFDLIKAEYHKKNSEYNKALKIYQSTMPKGKLLSDIDFEYAGGLQHYGLVYQTLSKYDSCSFYLEQANDIFRRKKDTTSLQYAMLCNNLGTNYLRLSDLKKSKTAFKKAIEVLHNLDAPSIGYIAMINGNLASIYSREGKYNDAIALVEESLAHNKSLNDKDIGLVLYISESLTRPLVI